MSETITRSEYESRLRHDYAGPGTPLHPDAPGVWWMEYDPNTGGTVLTTGGTIDDVDERNGKEER